jgi:hypothetical protein
LRSIAYSVDNVVTNNVEPDAAIPLTFCGLPDSRNGIRLVNR